mmetsp:Transcript_30821/g.57036  ORF Transcript_30821/g.57036 Transcript_30821/m.57036 type:complete len:160 (-) Transcript_30821:719-1198(-)
MPSHDYVDPPFPSPTDFPKFETVTDWAAAIMDPNTVSQDPMPDCMGERLRAYVKGVFMTDMLAALERNMSAMRHLDEPWPAAPAAFLSDDHKAKMKRLYSIFSKNRQGLFRSSACFQQRVTKMWNPNHGELTQMILLPMAGGQLEQENCFHSWRLHNSN